MKFFLLVFLTVFAWVSQAQERHISEPNLILGRGDAAADKSITAYDGTATPPKIDYSGGTWNFTNDGVNTFQLGSGSGGGGGVNLLGNPGFESGTTGWTASTPANFTTSTTPANVAFEAQAGAWDPAGAAETLVSDLVDIEPGLYGKACQIEFYYKYEGGSAANGDITYVIYDGSNIVLQDTDGGEFDLIVTNGEWRVASHGFVCPDSGQIQIRFTSTVDAEVFRNDQFHLGSDKRLGVLGDQAELMAHAQMPGVSGCTYTTTSAALAAFSSVGSCSDSNTVYVSSTTIDTDTDDLPRLKIPLLPAGKYKVTVTFSGGNDTSTNFAEFAINDGTDTRGALAVKAIDQRPVTLVAAFEYDADQTSHIFEIYGARETSGTTTIAANQAANPITWTVERFPNQSPRDTVTLETQGTFFVASIAGSNVDLGLSSDGATYNTVQDSSLTMTNVLGSVFIPCETGFSPTGTDCGGNDESVGIAFYPHKQGIWEVCANLPHRMQLDSNADILAQTFKLAVTNPGDYTILEDADEDIIERRLDIGITAGGTPEITYGDGARVCEHFTFTSLGLKTIRLFENTSATSSPVTNSLITTDGSIGRKMVWTAKPATEVNTQSVALVGPDSVVRVADPSGHGSTGTRIRLYDDVVQETGSCLSYTSDATNGDFVTVNCEGTYCAHITDLRGAAATSEACISINSDTTVSCSGLPVGEIIAFDSAATSTDYIQASGCARLAVGDILRPHTNGGNDCTTDRCVFGVAQVSGR